MSPAAAPLEVREVSVDYGANHVLDQVSLSAAGGEFIALLGASGRGKTTLLRAICGFVPLASGSITVRGPTSRVITVVVFLFAVPADYTIGRRSAPGRGLTLY
jgi:ABC-type Fe3+/spermidine/putrescine transport system ATPase subunit